MRKEGKRKRSRFDAASRGASERRRNPASDDGYVADPAALGRLVDDLSRERVIAVDMESNGFYRYPEFICLVQIGFGERSFLVDTVALRNIEPLLAVLSDPDKTCVLHSCSYDVLSFKRDYGCEFGRLYDTAVGAAFLGLDRLGLDSVVNSFLGLNVPKNKKLQRCDWTRRPLTPEQIDYAKSDVAHLPRLRELQMERLRRFGRLEWVEEECEAARTADYVPPQPPETAFAKAKLVNTLSPRGKAVFKELFIHRERVALKRGRPPFMILSNDAMLAIAGRCAASGEGLPPDFRLPRDCDPAGLEAAVLRGLRAPLIDELPRRREFQRLDAEQTVRLKRLKRVRARLGSELELDPSLLWRTSHLEKLARCETRGEAEAVVGNGEPRKWQLANFADAILAVYDD